MIDASLRKRFQEEQRFKSLITGVESGIKKAMPDLKLQEVADERTLTLLGKLGSALAIIHRTMIDRLALPKIFQVRGQVEVTYQPPVMIKNLKELEKYFLSLEKTFKHILLAIQAMPQPQIKLPRIEIPAQVMPNNAKLESLVSDLINKIDKMPAPQINLPKLDFPKQIKQDNSKLEELLEELNDRISKLRVDKFPKSISVDNFPITLTPQPVTHFSLNALQGTVKTTDNTVGTTLTKLPSYGQLLNRRAIMIFNNSNNTIYIGGSDITVNTGLPVPANSYSPPFDLGYNVILYGIASQASNDVRVIEVSDEASGR